MNKLEKIINFFIKKTTATFLLLIIAFLLLGIVLRYSQCTKYETYELQVTGEGQFMCSFNSEYLDEYVVWYTDRDDIRYLGVIEKVENGIMNIRNISDSWEVKFSSKDIVYAEIATSKRYLYELILNRNEE